MGGNLFNFTSRISKVEFDEVSENILKLLRSYYKDTRIDVIPSYRNKQSFGDIDIQVELSPKFIRDNPRELLMSYEKSPQIHKNGGVWSYAHDFMDENLEIKYVQVDLITQSTENYDTALNYYSWNDLGNLMGRIGHKMGFKYGHEGLVLIFRDGTHQYGQLVVSRDIRKIVEFLGYDYDRFAKGFDDLEDIFAFAASSEFFNKNIFAYENRNHIARTRDKKRENYRAFLEYIENIKTPEYEYNSFTEKGGRVLSDVFRERAYEFFPDLSDKVDEVEYELMKRKTVHEKFNGVIVSLLTGLMGKELGCFMQHLRQYVDVEKLYPMSPLEINHWVIDEYQKFRSSASNS